MFAGRMRLRTFLILATVSSVICGAGVVFLAGGTLVALRESPPPATISAPAVAGTPPAQAAPAAVSGRPWDSLILARKGQNLGTEKIKDASEGSAYKVNLYQDAGSSTMNRAKVDYDRDEKWDEKWTFAPDGAVERQVAPNDDENYTETWIYRDGSWSAK